MRTTPRGFTLVELMIVLAIVAIIGAVALPIYNSYVQTSRQGVLVGSIDTIRIFQEDFRLRRGRYAEGKYQAGVVDADLRELGWDPDTDTIEFIVDADNANPASLSYTVTATDNVGTTICRRFPGNEPC